MGELDNKQLDIKSSIDAMSDLTISKDEAEKIENTLNTTDGKDIDAFFADPKYKEIYEKTLSSVIAALEKYQNKLQLQTGISNEKKLTFNIPAPLKNAASLEKSVITFITTLKQKRENLQSPVKAENTNQKDVETPSVQADKQPEKPKTYGESINDKFTDFNNFLKENNIPETFGSMFEKTKATLKGNILNRIKGTLLKEKAFITKGDKNTPPQLNESGNKLFAEIEKGLSDDRVNNFTFGILNKLTESAKARLDATSGNKDKELNEKLSLVMAMKKIITPNTGIDGLQLGNVKKGVAEMVRKLIEPSSDLTTIEENLSKFFTTKLKEGGFDIEHAKKSIIAGAKEQNINILNKSERENAIINVVGKAFENTFSYFNNQQGTKTIINGLQAQKENGAYFDWSKVDKTTLNLDTKNQPTEKEIQELAGVLNMMTEGLPKTQQEQKQLKEKIAKNKFDSILDNFGQFKDIIIKVMERLGGTEWGKAILNFFGNQYGLDEKSINKLLDRPFIKAGIDSYNAILDSIKDGKIISDAIDIDTKDIKTDYFKLHNNIVCTKEKNSDGTEKYVIKQVDEKGKLQLLNETSKKLLPKDFLVNESGEVTQIEANTSFDQSKGDKKENKEKLFKAFIQTDLQKEAMKVAIATNLIKKEPADKTKPNNFGNLDRSAQSKKTDEVYDTLNVQNQIHALLSSNQYVFSTEDIVDNILQKVVDGNKEQSKEQTDTKKQIEFTQKKFDEADKKKVNDEAAKKGITLKNGKYTLKQGATPTQEDYKNWITVPTGGKELAFARDDDNKKYFFDYTKYTAGEIIDFKVSVIIDRQPTSIYVPVTII